MSDPEGKKVAVVGAGCAGLSCAWHLHRSGVDVRVFESESWIGGHANTISVDGVEVDTGFMVYNAVNYPHLVSLFRTLGVEGQATSMGFSVSVDNGNFEWCSDTLSGLFATRSNMINPRFYIMMRDIMRFNKEAIRVLALPDNDPAKACTVQQFLKQHRFSDNFTKFYLVPMTSAIWSASAQGILDFPVLTLFTFLNNHLLLQLTDHLSWLTPKLRSKEYVDVICSELGDCIMKNREVLSIRREQNGKKNIIVVDNHGEQSFDHVVFACHPDQALKILSDVATPLEKNNLSAFKYSMNDTYVHCDSSLMPKSKSAWASWNYIGSSQETSTQRPVFVSYWLNRLQQLQTNKDIFVSLNPFNPPAPDKTYARLQYAHPQYSVDSVNAQKKVQVMNGMNNTWFCGAWLGYGFHEDACRSGLEVAEAISKTPVPWATEVKHCTALAKQPASTVASWHSPITGLITRPLIWLLEEICRSQVLSFLSKAVTKGRVVFITAAGKKYSFGKVDTSSDLDVTVLVYKPWFWVRVALEADLGLARSYIAGEWAVENSGPQFDGLTRLLTFLIANMPTGKTNVAGGLDVSQLTTAWIGSALNMLWYRLTMDNSISNSRSNIHAHYDLSNDLFTSFLDKDLMMYSCAIFDTDIVQPSSPTSLPQIIFKDSLEEAQLRKVDTLLSRLEPLGPEHTLLDIGFGWGGICIRAAEKYGCKVHGITLSTEQKSLAERKVASKDLGHLVSFELVDYRLFARNGRQFDRIVSCEMIEAVGHSHLNDFFESVNMLLKPEGIFVMQAITMPDARYPVYHKSADFLNTIIFPGGCCPSLSALLNAMSLKSTLHLENAINMNVHYAHTLRHWRYRFNNAEEIIRKLGFDDAFIRLWNLYLCQCEAGFDTQVINLQILTFSRPGNLYLIGNRSMQFICR